MALAHVVHDEEFADDVVWIVAGYAVLELLAVAETVLVGVAIDAVLASACAS